MTAPAVETKETIWAHAMAGRGPVELADTVSALADCVYLMVDPSNGRVDLGKAGHGTSAMTCHDGGTRRLHPEPLVSGAGHAASFDLAAGSTLLLFSHDPAAGEAVTSAIERHVAEHSRRDEVEGPFLEWCLELRNGPLD